MEYSITLFEKSFDRLIQFKDCIIWLSGIIARVSYSNAKTGLKRKIMPLVFAFALIVANMMQAQTLTPGMDAVVTFFGPNDSSDVASVKIIGNQINAPHNVNWVPPVKMPLITNWTVGNLGQIFGTAIDDFGNVYFAATAMYKGAIAAGYVYAIPQRLADPPNQISPCGSGGDGYNLPGGAAGIYKADYLNLNNVSVLVSTLNAPSGGGIGTSNIPNTGYGIGNIAYAKGINKIYASNLEDGKIYCIDPVTGVITDVYDPFNPDASGAQIVDYGERIFGLAVNYELAEIRLYYAVLKSSSQSEIWSVKIDNNNGAFDPTTESIEILLPSYYDRTYISDMAFSSRGEMLVAEKGNPHNANVYQYFGKHNAWSLPQVLYMSSFNMCPTNPCPGHNGAGGVDYGYSSKDSSNIFFYCDTIIWTQSNAIRRNDGTGNWLAYGLLSHPLHDYSNPSTYLDEGYCINLKGNNVSSMEKGCFGDVECFDWECPPNQTDICGKVDAKLTQIDSGECCFNIEIANRYRPDYFRAVEINSHNLSIQSVIKDNSCVWANITFQSPTQVVFSKTIFYDGIPLDTAGLFSLIGTICFTGSGPDTIDFKFIGNPPQFDTVCVKKVIIKGCDIPVDTNCIKILDIKAVCEAGSVKMKFRIKNNSNFTIRGITIFSQNTDVIPTPKFIPIPDVLPGLNSSSYIETILMISNNATNACFFIAACDQNTMPGISGPYPYWCCLDSILYCVDIPQCDPCSGISIWSANSPMGDTSCSFDLTLINNYYNANIGYLEFNGIGGTQFAFLSGWSIIPYVSSNHIKIKAPGTGISPGSYYNFAHIDLTGTSTGYATISVGIFDINGILLCQLNLVFDCKLLEPNCASIINDSLYCVGTEIKYTFSVRNNSPFVIYHLDFRTNDGIVVHPKYIEPNPPIALGAVGGPYTIALDSIDENLEMFCIYLSAHNNIYDPLNGIYATECCTDSLSVVCLPLIDCIPCACCSFDKLLIPTGITPNSDGKNDVFFITNSEKCDFSIIVYNRWGNIVYKDGHYQNNWKGENENGEKLPQGTYYLLIELENGSKKGTYIDIRY